MNRTKHFNSIWLIILFFSLLGCGPTLEQRRKQASAKYELGVRKYSKGNLAEALEAFQEAEKDYPNDPRLRNAFGLIYIQQKQYQQAINEFKRALALDPNFFEANNNLGTTYSYMQNWDEAITEYRKLTNEPLYRTPELAYYNLGLALMERQWDGDLIEAVKQFHKAVQIRPNFTRALDKYGVSLYRVNRIQEAIKQFKKATEIDPEFIEPYLNLGIAYMKLGKRTEALQQFRYVLEHSTNEKFSATAQRYLEILE
jgi:superkiller protein 3